MIQDTRYKRRLDDLPNLRIHEYHTYHRTMDEGGHDIVTMIKHTLPSKEAEQIHLYISLLSVIAKTLKKSLFPT